jgi:predicted DCC family thiol-disulfide oxidoreductase YuxK
VSGIILFDGVCNLCNGFVQFVIRRDPSARFRFAALQSDAAAALLRQAGVSTPLPDSVVLVAGGRVHVRSAAVLRVARGLRFPWPLAYAGILVPPVIRDRLYDVVAARRYRWFGRRETCMVPTPDLATRFLGGVTGPNEPDSLRIATAANERSE